jgi:ATP-dependent DNA ligase
MTVDDVVEAIFQRLCAHRRAEGVATDMSLAAREAGRVSQVGERGYEGLVGKDEASPYREGRTLSWLKVKVPKYREGERGWDPK